MIVVSDTTPLNYLILIQSVEILPKIFQQVYIPPSVMRELIHPKAPYEVKNWVQAPPSWLTVMQPATRLASTLALDDGEADAISLAKQLTVQDILLDERRGRWIAVKEGLTPLPTLAILERAAALDLLELAKALQQLQKTSIRLPLILIQEALARDAARRTASKKPGPI